MSTNVERELGEIASSLRTIERDLQEAKTLTAATSTKLDTALNQISTLQHEMAEVKPVTDQMTRWRLVGSGVVLTVGFLGAMFGITVTTIGNWIQSFWNHQ